MGSLIFLDSAVVSHTGTVYETNEDNFYINGRYKHDYENSNVEVSLEENGNGFVYGVCDGIREENRDETRSFEMIKALKMYHEQFKTLGGDIDSKIKMLEKSVEETNNILFSKDIKNPNRKKIGFAFAGMILSHDRVSAINIGSCSVYLNRDGQLKQLTDEHKRVNKLVKLGILSSDQAKKVTGKKLKMSIGNEKVDTQVSESIKIDKNDVFLLCSDGLTKSIDEEKIKQILEDGSNSSIIANKLIQEARKNFVNDNITVMVIKINDLKKVTKKTSDFSTIEDNWGKVHKKPHRADKEDVAVTKLIKVAMFIAFICLSVALMYFTTKKDTQQIKQISGADSIGISEKKVKDNREDILEYKVKQGDTIESISQDFYADPEKYELIMKTNKIVKKENIKIGQILYLYPEGIIPKDIMDEINKARLAKSKKPTSTPNVDAYTVQSGDTLGSISLKFFGTILKADKIKTANKIKDESELAIGMKLKIPKGE